ncbi:MAG: UDP-galactopyranose mutase [Sulfuricurvum sp. PC08-66]|nr:MAG: UDP-galactopyranose mutase [Sulfuricurvum sp. PC08-66]
MFFDYIVVGAGISGAVFAHKIATQLNKKVLIIEKRNHIGGNCYDKKDENNILRHIYGPHLFHTNNKTVVDFLSQFTSWSIYNHEVLAYIDGAMVPIPFNLNTLYKVFSPELASRIEKKLLEQYAYNTKIPILELKKSNDKDLQFLADFIYEKIFVNYTAKQWGMKPEELDSAVTARVPVFIGRDNRYFNDTYQMLPEEGYTALFNKMLDHPNIKQMLNTDFGEVMRLDDAGKLFFLDQPFEGHLVYTGQIDELFGYKFGELPYRSVRMAFESVDAEFYQTAATENYPNSYDFTRITEFKRIHPVNSSKTTILKEYPQPYVRGQNTPYYPIFTQAIQERYNQYQAHAKNFKNITLVGRLAEYKYYDMDDMVESALEKFETLQKSVGK